MLCIDGIPYGLFPEVKKIDILINNAGIMMTPYGKTEDEFEQQLGVNHLGNYHILILIS